MIEKVKPISASRLHFEEKSDGDPGKVSQAVRYSSEDGRREIEIEKDGVCVKFKDKDIPWLIRAMERVNGEVINSNIGISHGDYSLLKVANQQAEAMLNLNASSLCGSAAALSPRRG